MQQNSSALCLEKLASKQRVYLWTLSCKVGTFEFECGIVKRKQENLHDDAAASAPPLMKCH